MTKDEFYNKWFQAFASNLSEKKHNKYLVEYGNYPWHLFSWKLVPNTSYLIGNDAREAYNKIKKDGALYIQPFEDEFAKPLPKEFGNSSALDKLTEIYIVSKDFSWTYIKTHEDDWCGPYFYKPK